MTEPGTPRPHRPPPIEWGVVEPLAARAQTIAKGWLLLLLERLPLEGVGAIPAATLAAEGPALCAAAVRGLGSDAELERLRSHGDLADLARRAGPICGADDVAATVAAIDALRACIWVAALEQQEPRAGIDAVRALADRLAAVTAVVTATALDALAPAAVVGEGASGQPGDASRGAASGALTGDDPPDAHVGDDAPAPGARSLADPSFTPGLDELPGPPALGGFVRFEDEPRASVTRLPQQPPGPRPASVDAMDDGDLWIETLERQIDRCGREGGRLALLRVELVDGERVTASAPVGEEQVPFGRLAQAIRRAIRRQDLVASDRDGRAWVIAPGVGRAGALALAERIGAGVEEGEAWQGAPLAATIGFGVLGEDGRDAVTLIERSEEAMLAASAAGVRIGEAVPQPGDHLEQSGGGDPSPPTGPSGSGPRLVR